MIVQSDGLQLSRQISERMQEYIGMFGVNLTDTRKVGCNLAIKNKETIQKNKRDIIRNSSQTIKSLKMQTHKINANS